METIERRSWSGLMLLFVFAGAILAGVGLALGATVHAPFASDSLYGFFFNTIWGMGFAGLVLGIFVPIMYNARMQRHVDQRRTWALDGGIFIGAGLVGALLFVNLYLIDKPHAGLYQNVLAIILGGLVGIVIASFVVDWREDLQFDPAKRPVAVNQEHNHMGRWLHVTLPVLSSSDDKIEFAAWLPRAAVLIWVSPWLQISLLLVWALMRFRWAKQLGIAIFVHHNVGVIGLTIIVVAVQIALSWLGLRERRRINRDTPGKDESKSERRTGRIIRYSVLGAIVFALWLSLGFPWLSALFHALWHHPERLAILPLIPVGIWTLMVGAAYWMSFLVMTPTMIYVSTLFEFVPYFSVQRARISELSITNEDSNFFSKFLGFRVLSMDTMKQIDRFWHKLRIGRAKEFTNILTRLQQGAPAWTPEQPDNGGSHDDTPPPKQPQPGPNQVVIEPEDTPQDMDDTVERRLPGLNQ